MEEINSLYFNDLEVEDDFRWLLTQMFSEDDIYKLFKNEVNFIPMDSDLKEKVDMPAVTFYIYQNTSVNSDDVQIQRYTPFTAEIEVYTSGDSKVLKNRELCNKIISIMQSNGPLPHYYCRGLKLQENTEMTSFIESAYRRIIRMTGICDNKQKLIKGE